MTITDAPPRWDLTPIFTGLDDRAFTNSLEGVFATVDRLLALYNELGIRATEPRPITDDDLAGLETALNESNELADELRTLSTYLYARITTDSRDDDAAARTVEMQTRTAPLGPLAKRLGSWLDALGVDEFVARSSVAAEHEFMLRKAAEGAELQMSEAEEALAA